MTRQKKRRLWKVWRSGGSKEDYINAKHKARSEVYAARKLAEEKRYSNILRRDDEKQALFKIAKKMSQSNVDVVGEKCVRNDYGTLAFTDTAKKEAWRSHNNRLLNEEFVLVTLFLSDGQNWATEAIFMVRQLQEKYLAKHKKLYFAFVDLEKVFDRVPWDIIWWAMRKLGVEEWIVRVVQAMYANAMSRVRVNGTFSDDFEV